MSIHQEAGLGETIDAFKSFLQAIGYSIQGELTIVDPQEDMEYGDAADEHFHHESYCRKCNEKNNLK